MFITEVLRWLVDAARHLSEDNRQEMHEAINKFEAFLDRAGHTAPPPAPAAEDKDAKIARLEAELAAAKPAEPDPEDAAKDAKIAELEAELAKGSPPAPVPAS